MWNYTWSMVRAWYVFTNSTGSKSYKVSVAFSCKHVCKFAEEAQFLCLHWCVTIMLNSHYTHTFIYNDGILLHVKCVTWCYFQKEIEQNAVIKSASFQVDVDHFALVFRREVRPYFNPFLDLRTSYNVQRRVFPVWLFDVGQQPAWMHIFCAFSCGTNNSKWTFLAR